ncbi:hypothetical protein MU0083_001501 [[Mycobacterium] kokjensenii]|uniref:Uncharacterized protein n=1 Tax=[Mycobacterium] kokjensenii TaxID=3064287 RepID=A0ABM9LCM3_9MYCO|nr:DUF6670 family protein [Mycolicibacter sp. MU0083]CAJ1496757.1 hypothetical protein MU0083_001501 [Mycolicibacter sp. MU0083]
MLDRRLSASVQPFTQARQMRPELGSRRWGWTHYGFFVPDLPEPYRYVNTMTLIGTTGTVIFDNGVVASADVRDTTTVLSSTAAADHHHYRAYDARRDCDFAADGSTLRWGEHLAVEADHPRYTVHGDYEEFGIDLEFDATQHVSYFVKTPVYDHFSLLAPYRGVLRDGDERIPVSGIGTVEYARCISPQTMLARPLPAPARLPVDFFTYQIIALPGDIQLLLTDVRAAGATACRLAQVRYLDRPAEVFDDVRFKVIEYADPQVDPMGRSMRVPRRLRWDILHYGREIASITGTVDSPLRFGHGRGYVGAYSYTGHWRGKAVSGSAYLEWVDCQRR